VRNINQKGLGPGRPMQKVRPYLKKKKEKKSEPKGLEVWLRDRAPV
jgi:hypothetical protein